MDRNSIIGTVLIFAILLGFYFYNSPSQEEIEKAKFTRDSLTYVEKQKEKQKAENTKKMAAEKARQDSVMANMSDSAKAVMLQQQYGTFASAITGENQNYILENEVMKVTVSSKGGRVTSVILKNYKSFDGKPLEMMDKDSSRFSLNFFAQNKPCNTDSLFFKAEGGSFAVTGKETKNLAMRLYSGNNKYIEYLYTLKGDDYMMGFKLNVVGMNDVIAPNTNDLVLNWQINMPSVEKSLENQRNASSIYYYFNDGESDYISERKDEKVVLENKTKWIGFKQQYFSSVIISENGFEKPEIETYTNHGSTKFVKNTSAKISLPYTHSATESYAMNFYYGPNHFNTLKSYDMGLQHLVPLGWGIFGWVNRFAVIPVFNFLDGFALNYGIIILILTIFIKLVLFPLTYKAYLSTAKMRVLKPEMDEINKKFGTEDALKKQQATMELYRKAGVNPLGGCLPMLLQMPILIAMFRFFPASIELRQQSFLWADDLSTYDSVYDFGFNIPFYGDHVSLFTLLMTVSTIIYTRMNNQLTADNPQMAQLKWMMYLMPIIFLGVFNNYSSGLSYYYFLANMITFGQQYAMRLFVDEKAIHAKIEENKKKPVKQSAFQKRLEEMAKQKGMPKK